MRWTIYQAEGLAGVAVGQQGGSEIRSRISAFLSACQDRYPPLQRELRERLSGFGEHRDFSESFTLRLPGRLIDKLLRWCITDGNHLQDIRRENARSLWSIIFSGPIPTFYRYQASEGTYQTESYQRQ
jgi:hypothetical protein